MMENLSIPKSFVLDVLCDSNCKSLSMLDVSKRVFDSICQRKGVDLLFTERIQCQMRYQISKLRNLLKSRRGTKAQDKLKESYKSNMWYFKVLRSEYKLTELQNQRDGLLLTNSKLRKELSKVRQRLKNLKQKYKARKSKLKKLKTLRDKISLAIVRTAKKMKAPRPFASYSRSWQHSMRASAKDKCNLALSYLGLHNYEVYDVVLKNNTTKKFEKITLVDDVSEDEAQAKSKVMCNGIGEQKRSLSPEKLEIIRLLILIKDENNMSDRAYAAIAGISDLPTLYALKQEMDIASNCISFNKTHGKEPGVERDMESVLKYKIEALAEQGKVGGEDNTIRVKISGDGTIVGKSNHFVNVTCTIINDKDTATSVEGHEPIVIINGEEKYDVLKAHLVNVVSTVNTFSTFVHNGIEYKIEYYLGGDYKFLLEVLGLGAANSNYSCIYCKKPKSKYHDSSIIGELRTIEEIIECSHKRDNDKTKFCCKREPIFSSIPLSRVVVDSLHLFLRISDKLTNALIRDLEIADHMTGKKNFDRSKATHMAAFEDMLLECDIYGVRFYVKDDGGGVKPRDLTGPEKLKLFGNLDKVEALLRTCKHRTEEEVDQIMVVWREFFSLYDVMRNASTDGVEQMSKLSKQWLQLYISIFTSRHVTPYMHVLSDHASDIVNMHGSINVFNSQGLEKRNHTITVDFFKSTNHRRGQDGIESLSQLMKKCNRKMYLVRHQIAVQKRMRTCSLCLKKGHDKRVCGRLKL